MKEVTTYVPVIKIQWTEDPSTMEIRVEDATLTQNEIVKCAKAGDLFRDVGGRIFLLVKKDLSPVTPIEAEAWASTLFVKR